VLDAVRDAKKHIIYFVMSARLLCASSVSLTASAFAFGFSKCSHVTDSPSSALRVASSFAIILSDLAGHVPSTIFTTILLFDAICSVFSPAAQRAPSGPSSNSAQDQANPHSQQLDRGASGLKIATVVHHEFSVRPTANVEFIIIGAVRPEKGSKWNQAQVRARSRSYLEILLSRCQTAPPPTWLHCW